MSSSLSNELKRARREASYASCVVAAPVLYTPSGSQVGLTESGSLEKNQVLTINGIVYPFVDGIDTIPRFFRVDVNSGELSGKKGVEGGVQDADNFGTFVIDDSRRFLVP